MVGGRRHAPATTPGKGQGTHLTGGWVGSREGVEGWGACNITKISEQKVFGPQKQKTEERNNRRFVCTYILVIFSSAV